MLCWHVISYDRCFTSVFIMDLEVRVPVSFMKLWNVVLQRVMRRSSERVRQGLSALENIEELVYGLMFDVVDVWSMSGTVLMCERCWSGVDGMLSSRPEYDAFLCRMCRRFELQWRDAHRCGIEVLVYVGEYVVWRCFVTDVLLEMLDRVYADHARPMLPRLPVVC